MGKSKEEKIHSLLSEELPQGDGWWSSWWILRQKVTNYFQLHSFFFFLREQGRTRQLWLAWSSLRSTSLCFSNARIFQSCAPTAPRLLKKSFYWVLRGKLDTNKWKGIRCQGSSTKSEIVVHKLILHLQTALTQFFYALILWQKW